jgi:hypothetical protein
MPKPSFIWTTFQPCTSYTYISRIWSKAKEHMGQLILKGRMKQCSWKARLFSDRHIIRTARCFKRHRRKEFWKRSKTGRWVSGGKHLSSSASYTPAFCNALLDCYAANVELVELHGPLCLGNTMGIEFVGTLLKMGFSLDVHRSIQPRPHRKRWAVGIIGASSTLPCSRVSHILDILRPS